MYPIHYIMYESAIPNPGVYSIGTPMWMAPELCQHEMERNKRYEAIAADPRDREDALRSYRLFAEQHNKQAHCLSLLRHGGLLRTI